MSRVLQHLPEIEGDEQVYVARLLSDMTDDEAEQFAHVYRSRRRNPTYVLLLALIGFGGIAGVHRFYLEHLGMGLLYLFTAGLCFIGTIVDLFNHKSLALRYNRKVADEVALLVSANVEETPDD